jgi:YidC/Oxa1 family membrane protein insertase
VTLSRLRSSIESLVPYLALIALALIVAACAGPAGSPGASGAPAATPPPQGSVPLKPVPPSDFIAWIFTPIFQGFFILLVVLDKLTGNIAIAIILMTIVIYSILIPITAKQLVSTRRTQLLAPEVRAIQKRFKGDRVKQQEAQRQLYAERGINQFAGCLPSLLSILLLIPMYSVFTNGLTNYNPQAMLEIFGFRILDLHCDPAPIFNAAGHVLNPCLDPNAFGVNWGVPEVIIGTAGSLFSGLSLLALISALIQVVSSRMSLPPHDPTMADDPNYRVQRQMAYIIPFISLIYGSILPAGMFLYWITSTIYRAVQTFLFMGWGGMFPLFGWTPGFARNHTPRFPVTLPPPVDPKTRPTTSPLGGTAGRLAKADQTIRHKERGRQGRRGRRR